MPFPLRSVSAIALASALAGQAGAEISAADVLSNQQAYLGALGLTLDGTVDGETLSDVRLFGAFPMGIGSITVTASDLTMVENGDGTVTVGYPDGTTIDFSGSFIEVGGFSGTLRIVSDSYQIEASGTPGDITYLNDSGETVIELVDFTADQIDPAAAVAFRMVIDSWTSENRITEGNVITQQTNSTIGENRVEMIIDDGAGLVVATEQTTGPTTTTGMITLPVGGSNILNLSDAIRAGLSFDLESEGGAVQSETISTMAGEVVNRQTNGNGDQKIALRMDETGFFMAGEVPNSSTVFEDEMLFPMPISVDVANATFDIALPTVSGPDPQAFKFAIGLDDMTIDEGLWAMFDPAAQLPRDPADIVIDLSGTGVFGFDPLDFLAYETMDAPDATIDAVEINDLRITAAGAEATARGGFTFDWSDMFTIPGIARPEGEVEINVFGLNKLLDTLVAMGYVSEDDLFGIRMMSGMFAEVTGDDALRSVIEVNEEGHVLANGQRLR